MATETSAPTPRFDIFYKHDELTRLLFEYAQALPTLAAIRSIGKSYEGREIWVATVTNSETGPADDKPAFWCDGNIHAGELTASTACLYWMITGHPPRDFPPGVNPVTIVLRQPPIPIRDRLSTVPAALAEVIDAVLGDTIEPTATQLAAALTGAI